jgi:hypothetical protein
MYISLPNDVLCIIYDFAAYFPGPWIHVAEHKRGDYGWLPDCGHMDQDLIDLPMW